ncbi:Myb-like protein [Phytophthora cinnamomi]|uniref:Myb-like protein n=1 Tax=Phytophthora cinnamomi TaxID=4785 RepID=UPI003559BE85|nr:Myb-like protein [Phytophthora cinnamomi]
MSFTNMVESAAAASEWTQQQQQMMDEAKPAPEAGRGLWSPEEHRLFVDGIKLFPSGPWKDIASHVGSRTARQTMTHAQKYRQKIARRLRNARMNAKHNLPFLMDRTSRFNALLSSDEQFNDSILATSLAIAAEQELDVLGEPGDGGASPVQMDMQMQLHMQMQMGMSPSATQPNVAMEPMGPGNTYQKQLPLAIDFSSTEGNPYYLDGPSFEPSDVEFDKCMDFLIETFHRET